MLANPYCTVNAVQAEIKNTDSAIVPRLEDCINTASRWIDDYMGRDFYLHDYSTDPLRVSNNDIAGKSLFLPHRPIITLSRVVVEQEDWTLNEDYYIEGGQLVSINGTWPKRRTPADMTFLYGQFGYRQSDATMVPDGIPQTISQACAIIAGGLSGYMTKDQVGLDGSKVNTTENNIPARALKLLGSGGVFI